MVRTVLAGMKSEERIFLGLGTNEGDRDVNLKQAIDFIQLAVGEVVQSSAVYETAAWGIEDQASFLNMVIEVRSPLPPLVLLDTLLAIEQKMGRIRKVKWGERLIDLDVLFYGERIIEEERLQVPHPFIPQRNFVLAPFVEIAPKWMHPVLKVRMEVLMERSLDNLAAKRVHK
ncbi:MAG: 2-amino-4-hydroxy-6-hydroxymethyldihydropteridine diphosphokinase [Bacteroidota bacterium]